MSAQDRELRNRPWVVIFILMSLLAHLLLVVAIVVISHFVPPPKLQASNNLTTVSLSLEPPPPVPPSQTPRPKHLFMPTKADAQAPHKETLIESDQDSRLRSQSAVARDANTIMPDVNVKQAHPANLQDSPNAPNKTPPKPAAASAAERQEKTAQQSPHPLLQPQLHPAQAQKITPEPRPEAQQVEENPSATPAPKPVAKEQLDPNGLPVLPPISAPTMAPASQRHEVAMPASSMPEVAQNVNGAVGTHGDDSPEAMATELGRYKAKVYRAVGALWYEKVEKAASGPTRRGGAHPIHHS